MDNVRKIKMELRQCIDQAKADYLQNTSMLSVGYGEGDQFMGVTVPNQRKIAKKYYRQISTAELEKLLRDPVHECRLTALFIMVHQYERSKDQVEKEEIVRCYLNNLSFVNNWDLVDSSAYKILGPHLENKDRQLLYELAETQNLWMQRVAIITTLHFIRNHDFADALKIAEKLLDHPHDLIHKAVGWMLREVGNRDQSRELYFLDRHYRKMPRTMLRYAIEKFKPELREQYLKGKRCSPSQ